MSIAPNLADPRVRRTRQLLLNALKDLLGSGDFESITVQDIAARATVNRATFYAHFEDKYALLDSLIHEWFLQEVTGRLPASPTLRRSTLYTLAVVVFELLGQVDGHCSPTDQQTKPSLDAALQHEIKLTLLDWFQRLDTPAASPDTLDAVATVMSWAIFGAGSQWGQEPRPRPVDEAARQVVDVLLAGVAQTIGLDTLA